MKLCLFGVLGALLLVYSIQPAFGQTAPLRVAGYQIGAFGDEARAQATKTNLGRSGLFSEIHQKTVNGFHYWVVLVPVSDIPFENIRQKLLDAGFPVMDVSKNDWELLQRS